MTRLIHMRGDMMGMFLFFIAFFLGLWQVVVAWKRLNGFSLTGSPDRKAVSYISGIAIMAASCVWYFSGKGHFASPDLEGIETLLVMVGGLVVSSVLQGILAQLAFVARRAVSLRRSAISQERGGPFDEVSLTVGDAVVPCSYYPARGDDQRSGVLLLHDYGGSRGDVKTTASSLADRGHATLTIDLDGHGDNLRGIDDASMEALLSSAIDLLEEKAGDVTVNSAGVGFGGLLAMQLASEGSVARAVCIDPPARDIDGYHDVNSLREFGIAGIIAESFKPTARGASSKGISFSRLVASLPNVLCGIDGGGHVTVIGTRGPWLNDSAALTEFAHQCSPFDPLFLKGTHESLPLQDDTIEILSEVLG